MTPNPSRPVRANQIVSPALPSAVISVDPSFTYVGGPRFQLYGIAHVEQHLFVITDEQQTVRQFIWVQFEGFLPDNQRSYLYPVTQTVDVDGHPFIYDTFAFDIEREVALRPDSDLAAAYQFVERAGHRVGGAVRAQRFVHLIGTDKRNELMIIYGESSGEHEQQHAQTAQAHALACFSVQFLEEQ